LANQSLEKTIPHEDPTLFLTLKDFEGTIIAAVQGQTLPFAAFAGSDIAARISFLLKWMR
jgi:hypothetical protein